MRHFNLHVVHIHITYAVFSLKKFIWAKYQTSNKNGVQIRYRSIYPSKPFENTAYNDNMYVLFVFVTFIWTTNTQSPVTA